MLLPINKRNAPFKPKYIDEETPMFARWFVFGKAEDGTVWITDGTNDVVEGISPADADRIVALRNHWCERILEILNA